MLQNQKQEQSNKQENTQTVSEKQGVKKETKVSDEKDKLSQKKVTFMQPGKRIGTGYVERCNGNIRKELFECICLQSLNEVRDKAEQW